MTANSFALVALLHIEVHPNMANLALCTSMEKSVIRLY